MKKHNFTTKEGYAKHVLNQANILLDKCKIYEKPEDRKGLMDDILMSIEAKSGLFEIFKNSPYHNGKGQLIIQMDIERPIDEDVIFDFADYIVNVAKKYLLVETTIDGYTYNSVVEEMDKIDRITRAVDYMNISYDEVIIKGEPFTKYREMYRNLDKIHDTFLNECIYINNKYVSMENKDKYDKALLVANAIRNCVGRQLENADDIKNLAEAFPHSQCREGIRITKVIQKCLKELGLYQIAMDNEQETFNKRYAYWCDAVNPMKIKKWSVLSINFVDFLTMSHGSSWTSCLNTDKRRKFTSGNFSDGFNSRRVLDYALDPSTMVFYTIDENYDADGKGDDWELQPKNTRQLFHFGEGKLIQARLYPQGNIARRDIYTQYRENVEKLLADALGEANLWSAPERGTIDAYDSNILTLPYESYSNGDFIDFLDNANHAGWERDFKKEVNYVVFKGSTNRTDNGIPMTIGSTDAVCITCGKKLSEHYNEAIQCSYCY